MRSRTRTILLGLAAVLALSALVLGVPMVLAREVGWPLPTAVPSWGEFSRAVTTGTVRDATIIKALAVLVWLAWLDFTSGVVAEVIGILRGRGAVRAGGLRTAQQVAARLVAMVAVAASLLARPTVGAAAPVDLRLAVAESTAQSPYDSVADSRHGTELADAAIAPPDGGRVAAEPMSAARVASSETLHEVQRGDTLWDLAERHLGDGMRWRDIRAANLGREQPDGERIGPETEALRTGWTLVIPTKGPHVGDRSLEHVNDAEEVVVEKGDTLWDLAEEHLGDPHDWPRLHEENLGDPQSDGLTLIDPDVIRPGWSLQLPPPSVAPGTSADRNGHGADTAPPPPPAPVELEQQTGGTDDVPESAQVPTLRPPPPPAQSPMPTPSPVQVVESGEAVPDTPEDPVPMAPVAAAGTLAAGLVLTLDRLRRARLRRREPGRRIPLPDPESAAVESRLRALADPDTARFLDFALRELSDHLADLEESPEVGHVTHDAVTVSVHLTGQPVDPPQAWAREEELVWTRERPADLDEFGASAGAPTRLPALVTLGATAADRVTLLNLAHTRRLHVTGGDRSVHRLLLAWALELATTPRADALDVITVGIDGLPAGLERLQRASGTEQLRDLLVSRSSGIPVAVPTSVLLANGLPEEVADLVEAGCGSGVSTIAVIAGQPSEGQEWTLHLEEGGRGRLDPLGLQIDHLDLGGEALPMTARLLEQALHDPDQLVRLPPDPDEVQHVSPPGEEHRSVDQEGAESANEDQSEPETAAPVDEPPVEVRVLGPVEVVGAPEPFRTNKTVELVTYLALHRVGADTDTLLEALWPAQEPRPARLYTEASRARKALGTAADGTPHLPDAELGRYRLGPTVALDHERFTAEVAAARCDPDRATEHLRRALGLVRGVPLSATGSEYAWATNETYRLAQEVVDAAHDLAQLSLDAGRWEDCTWAAERGLLADPLAEVLIRDLMQAAAATGNTARVHAAMTRLRRQVAEDGDANDADDWLHPDTVALFESLTGTPV